MHIGVPDPGSPVPNPIEWYEEPVEPIVSIGADNCGSGYAEKHGCMGGICVLHKGDNGGTKICVLHRGR